MLSRNPDGEVTGLEGGVPGGTYRKLTAEQLDRVQDATSPSGRVSFQLPRAWGVRWTGDAFRAGEESGPEWVLTGETGQRSYDEVVEAIRAQRPADPVGRVLERSETVGRYVWRERIWSEEAGGARRQLMLAYTDDAGVGFHVLVITPFGERTQAVRDVLVPLMTSLEAGTGRGARD